MDDGKDKKDLSPFTLRLTFEERAQLERDAAGLSLGAYVRSRVFDTTRAAPRRRGKFPVKDQKALASVLAMLGQSRFANNLNQLARAANTGSLVMTPDTEATLKGACRDIASIRHMLMVALGLADANDGKSDSASLHLQFASSASEAAGDSAPMPKRQGRYRPRQSNPASPAP
jgi:Bacterial mobilisation protein (MobC)